MAQRPPLTLTAELEKLEQSITLTLQEIDHNFSKTHRIVTNSIIPIVERYAKESTAVWEGSKFWKQFFEASANVALSNYQEEEEEEEPTYGEPTAAGADGTTYVTHDSSAFPNSSPANYERTRGPAMDDDGDEILQTTAAAEHHAQGGGGGGGGPDSDDDDDYLLDDSMLDSLNLTGAITHHSTPKPKAGKPPQQQQPARQWANIESPFEAFKKEFTANPLYGGAGAGGRNDAADDDSDTSLTDSLLLPPSTPPTNRSRRRPTPRAHNPSTPTPTTTTTTTITSSPFLPPHTARRTPGGATTDALLHRVLDKNWRVQATPLGKAPASKYRTTTTTTTTGAATPHSTRRLFTAPHIDSDTDSDDDRSPEKPQLHTKHLFSPSPAPGPRAAHLNLGPKTPTTTTKHKKGKAVLDPWIHNDATNTNSGGEEEEEEEEDSDDNILGYSPPQTIQFSFPARKLLATPAREASRRIVKDILMTAGAAGDTSSAGHGGGGDSFSSPPFVSGRGGGGGDSDEDIF